MILLLLEFICLCDLFVLFQAVKLQFNAFELQPRRNMGCYNDYLGIFDGKETGVDNAVFICGDSAPEYIQTAGNVATLLFSSDGAQRYDGYTITYTTVNANGK